MISRISLSLILLVITYAVNAQSVPSVVVSIKPIHSIVSSIMQGVGKPKLLMEADGSAHSFHLRPSQASALEKADLIIYIDPNFENGLANILSNYKKSSKIAISKLNLASFYQYRETDGDNHEHEYDYHLWLDINNTRLIAKYINARLIEIDERNASIYSSNLDALDAKLIQLHKDNKELLSPLSSSNFANFSDTLQYFEKSYGLIQPIIITPYHGARLSIQMALNAKKKIKQKQVGCLLHTNEVSIEKTKIITAGISILRSKISILGNELDKGPDQYFELMKNLTSKIGKCLQ